MSGKKGGKQDAPKSDFKFNFGGESEGKAPSTDLVKMVQNQLGSLVGKSSGYFESLPKQVQERVALLKLIQNQKDEVDEKFQQELRDLEAKYEKLFAPFYEKRSKVVSGEVEPSAEELEASKQFLPEGTAATPAATTDEKGIPQFWLTALSHSEFKLNITEQDEEILKYLKDISAKNVEEGPSFSLTFTFGENPFFNETVLVKTYHLEEQGGTVMFDHIDPVKITWKEGKNPLVRKVTKTQKPKKGGRGRGGKQGVTRTVTVEEPCESFFHFFNPEHTPYGAEEDDEDEEVPDIQEIMEMDYDLGMALKEDIIPNAVLYFTGEAEDDGDYDMEEMDDEQEEGEEGDDSEDDADFDPATAAPAPNPQDCKQQ